MRSMIAAESPVLLWHVLRMVHAVLRGSPSALACASSVRNPASIRACPSSRILADWRAFISAKTVRVGLVCVDSVRFGGAAIFFSPERTLVAGTSTAENLLTAPTLCYLRAIQVYARNAMLLTATSSIEHQAAQYGQSSIEHRAARQLSDNRKKVSVLRD